MTTTMFARQVVSIKIINGAITQYLGFVLEVFSDRKRVFAVALFIVHIFWKDVNEDVAN